MNGLVFPGALKASLVAIKEQGRRYYDRLRACHFGLSHRQQVQCNICGWRGAKFLNYYGGFGHVYFDAECGGCSAHPRHRNFHLYVQHILPKDRPVKVLHFAPEPALQRLFQGYGNVDYLSVDLEPGRAMRQEDITRLSFPDKSFDVIFCVHVLEHVPDDKRAMAELVRVLADDGMAIIDVPIDYGRETTYEDPGLVTPEARTKAYWQWDHVRLYGRDFGSKLADAGFNVEADRYIESLGDAAVKRHGLEKIPIYLCRRRPAG